MIFLIHYHRSKNKTLSIKQFTDNEKLQALSERLQLELLHNGSSENTEIVILIAPTEASIRHTHARYFENGLQDAIARLQ